VRERSVLIWLVLGAALLVALNLPESLSQRGKSAIREFLAPLQSLVSGTTTRAQQLVLFVRGLGDLARDNQAMSGELVRLRSELRYLETLEQENIALRQQLGFMSRPERELIPGEVIARDITGWWHTVRLGQGSAENIQTGMAVVTPEGLVGRTMQVSAGTSDVLLVSDPTCRVSAFLPRTGSFGVMTGRGVTWRGRPSMRLEFINKDAEIQTGDEVLTSGLGGVFPRGILIGHVERVYMDEGGLYQLADVEPAADLGRLAYVFVVAENADPVEQLFRRRDSDPQGGR
jgi:rod shape-determining protein MreC